MFATLRFVHAFMGLARRRRKSPEYMQDLQDRRFRDLIQFAGRHSPFYRLRFSGINLATCRPADLPTLTKPEMMSQFDDVVTDPAIHLADLQQFVEDSANLGKYFRGKYVVCHTSGSQGQPAIIVQDRHAMSMAFGTQLARGNPLPKTYLEVVKRLLFRARIAVVTLRRGFYPSGAAFEYMPTAMQAFTKVLRLSQTDGMDHVVRRLNEFQPNFMSAYASVLEMLAREEKAGRLRLRQTGCLQQITNMSEPLPEASRDMLQQVFGVRVADNYAMAECMALSNGCTQYNGSHINMDLALLEVVDEHNRSVPVGTRGAKVLITNLYNRVQPLIRYEVGDVITISPEPCPCGSNLPFISSIQGRTKDKFWISDGKEFREVLPYVFMAPMLYCLDVAEHQVIQTERNTFLARVAPLPGGKVDLGRVKRHMAELLHKEDLAHLVHLNFETVDAIRPDARSGKVKRMMSQVGPPAEKMESDADRPPERYAGDGDPELTPSPRRPGKAA